MNKYKLLIIICFFLITLCLPRVTATVKNLNLLGKVIILDAGHGGKDEGASSGPIKESKLNLILTKKLEKELISRGATVYLTRKDDNDLSTTTINRKRNDLYNRAKYINDISPDMYISIHLNASPSPSWRGLQVFYTGNNKENKIKLFFIFTYPFFKKNFCRSFNDILSQCFLKIKHIKKNS